MIFFKESLPKSSRKQNFTKTLHALLKFLSSNTTKDLHLPLYCFFLFSIFPSCSWTDVLHISICFYWTRFITNSQNTPKNVKQVNKKILWKNDFFLSFSLNSWKHPFSRHFSSVKNEGQWKILKLVKKRRRIDPVTLVFREEIIIKINIEGPLRLRRDVVLLLLKKKTHK